MRAGFQTPTTAMVELEDSTAGGPEAAPPRFVEVLDEREMGMFRSEMNVSTLWRDYKVVAGEFPNLAMKRVFSKADIFPVFHDLFQKREAA